jgi:TRAP-type C4-dicarboxylate transport system substrate-binding protein
VIARAAALTVVLWAGAAEAQLIRLATAAPDGTAWAREFKAFAREMERETHGAVHVKWFFGSIAGNEIEVLDRIRRDQLDGAASAIACTRLSPTWRIFRVLGLFQSYDETRYISSKLHPVLEKEFRESGFTYFGGTVLGHDVLFLRKPIAHVAQLRVMPIWLWNLDDVLQAQWRTLGWNAAPMELEEAGRAYDEHRIDGFNAIASAALAFQWSAQARYIIDLKMGVLSGCFVIASRAFDQLTPERQEILRGALAKAFARVEDVSEQQERALVGGLFQKQGLQPVPVGDVLRAEFFDGARMARAHLDPKLVSPQLIAQVSQLLADYRAEHRR